jgi:Lon protease-like protein
VLRAATKLAPERHNMAGSNLLPHDFSGSVRLFPLPDLVMFPHVAQPLRVFEPRYVAMLEDAMQSDELITMALLQPGWETGYEGKPLIHSTVCIGRVISHSRQPDGCYNLLLAGLARARILRELETSCLYRVAEAELLANRDPLASDTQSAEWRSQLLEAFQQLNPQGLAGEPSIQQLLNDEVPLSILTDVIAFAAPLRLAEKQQLLAEPNELTRVHVLIESLRRLTGSSSVGFPLSFPPTFSDN